MVVGGRGVGTECVLELVEQGCGRSCGHCWVVRAPMAGRDDREPLLEFADVSGQRGEQRIARVDRCFGSAEGPGGGRAVGAVGDSGRGRGVGIAGVGSAGALGDVIPELRAGVVEPEVDVAMLGERGENLESGGVDPGRPVQAEPLGEGDPVGIGPDCLRVRRRGVRPVTGRVPRGGRATGSAARPDPRGRRRCCRCCAPIVGSGRGEPRRTRRTVPRSAGRGRTGARSGCPASS